MYNILTPQSEYAKLMSQAEYHLTVEWRCKSMSAFVLIGLALSLAVLGALKAFREAFASLRMERIPVRIERRNRR
jgi:hypothetical protein